MEPVGGKIRRSLSQGAVGVVVDHVTSKKKKQAAKPRRARRLQLPPWLGYALLVVAIAVHVGLVFHFNFTQDDAFITFRYAANFLNDHGLVYNAGERVEGFTNFFWTILMILGGRLGFGFVLFSQIIGTLMGAGTIVLAFFFAKELFRDLSSGYQTTLAGLACLALGTVYSFAYWTVAGLETAAFAFMVLASLYLYIRRSPLAVASLVLATLLRPEGGMVFIFIVLYEIISRRSLTTFARTIFALYAIFLLPLAGFKLLYYKSLLPNPFYAKTSFNLQQALNGLDYTGRFFWHYLAAGIFAVPIVLLLRKIPAALRVTLAFLLVYILYIIFIGGDVLKVHRFFVPLFALIIPVVVYGFYHIAKGKAYFLFGVAALIIWQLVIPRDYVNVFHGRELGLAYKMDHFTRHLLAADSSDFSLAASTIGLVGYRLLDHTVIDMLGLTDSTIARHPEPHIEGLETTWREANFNSEYLLSRQPKYILFSTGTKPSAPAERALFLYSAFLDDYRTIGFYFGGMMHGAYKRYFPLDTPVTRDVDVEFVQAFNEGMNQARTGHYSEALAAYEQAILHGPNPPYPYVFYYLSEVFRQQGKPEASYNALKKGAALDTLAYEIYKDLYAFEYRLGNFAAADGYRRRVAALVPWYMPRLDSLVGRTR